MKRTLSYLAVFVTGQILGYFCFPGFTINTSLSLLMRRSPGEAAIALLVFDGILLLIVAVFYGLYKERE